jgi:predicted nucleic acid-binding protein
MPDSSLYWDTSALVEALQSHGVRDRLETAGGWTRPHALAEVFSTLTGGRLGFRCQPDDAFRMIGELAGSVELVELGGDDTLAALSVCQESGVRGGLVHDFLHAAAAEKAGAGRILTLNERDFLSFGCRIPLERP